MTKLIIKLFGYDQAQGVLTRNYDGQQWYMAFDICRLLGIAGYSQAVHSYLKSTEWKKKTEYTGGSNRKLLMISESGLYKLIQVARNADDVKQKAKAITAPLRPVSWPEEQVDAEA